MKNKQAWLIIFFTLISLSLAKAQVNNKTGFSQNRIFMRSADIYDSSSSASIKKIRESWGRLGKYIIEIDSAGGKTKFKRKKIWGYKRVHDNNIKRMFDGDTCLVEEISEVIIYKYYVKHGTYFFSTVLDSPIILLNKRKLIKAIGNDRYLKLCSKSLLVKQLMSK